jgi:hypothetical protein
MTLDEYIPALATVTTREPTPIPALVNAIFNASDPLATPTQKLVPMKLANAFSKVETSFPKT